MNMEASTPHRNRRRVGSIAAIAALSLVLTTGAAAAADAPSEDGSASTGEFTDVTEENVFVDDIAWMARNDVTRGCNPPSNDRYCPSEFVTRGQMAAFMHRLARSRSVDAGWLLGADWNDFMAGGIDGTDGTDGTDGGDGQDGLPFDTSQFLGADAKAVDSDRLDGLDSTDFLRADDQAADSDTLDGKDSSDFLGVTFTSPSETVNLTAGVADGFQVMCSDNEVVMSGGYDGSGLPGGASIEVTQNHPDGNGWTVVAESSANGSITVYARCMAKA
jgi:hypothetical protein